MQDATPVVAVEASVQLAPGLLNAPGESLTKLTDPVGVLFVPASVSDTVAVHVDALPTVTELGEHATDVEVERFATAVTAKLALPPLAAWVLSPP